MHCMVRYIRIMKNGNGNKSIVKYRELYAQKKTLNHRMDFPCKHNDEQYLKIHNL